MPTLIADPGFEHDLKRQRAASGADRFDEVWDGVYVMSPLGDIEHQFLATRLAGILESVIGWPGLGLVLAGVNVSDRHHGWKRNYRIPDVAVYLNTTTARHHGTHWQGGPDFAVEITSHGDITRQKLPFYAAVGTRELLLLDRDTWTLELHRLQNGQLTLASSSTADDGQLLTSAVIPFTFRLTPGQPRPTLEVKTHGEAQAPAHWTF